MTYTYDSFGRKVSTDAAGVVQTNYAYDEAGRLTSIDSPAGTFSFVSDTSNRRSELHYPNGVVATYGYDENGRLVDYLATGPQGPVAKSAYTLDNTGNRTSQTTLFDTTHYSYDAAMQLIESIATLPGAGVEGKDNRKGGKGSGQQAAVSNQAERYAYDSVGNRLTGPDGNDWYEYATGNLLVKDSSASYQYDANGNLIMMQGADWWVAYEYDYENRLTRVTDSGGMDVSYKYGPMGRRIEKDVLGTVTRYFYDGEDIAFEYSPGGAVGNVYVHGPGVDEPLGLVQTRGMYYYHADGLGSIIGITDASASLVQSYEYDSFGNLKDRKNRVKQPYAYTGREYDRETGLYYYRARYYMPEIGRFISADPVSSVNLYTYVENRPIGAVDPWGLTRADVDEAVKWAFKEYPVLKTHWKRTVMAPFPPGVVGMGLKNTLVLSAKFLKEICTEEEKQELYDAVIHELLHIYVNNELGFWGYVFDENQEKYHQWIYDTTALIIVYHFGNPARGTPKPTIVLLNY
jgi:RHS repeat-associated protein